jgi:hypothetical protein
MRSFGHKTLKTTGGYAAGAEGAVGVTSFIPRAEQSGFGRARISASTLHTTLGYFGYPSAAHLFVNPISRTHCRYWN